MKMDATKLVRLEKPLSGDTPLWDAWLSKNHLFILMAADEVGLFTSIAAGINTADTIAVATSLNPRACDAVLYNLTVLGFLSDEDGYFKNTLLSKSYLLPTSSFYWGGLFEYSKNVPLSYDAFLGAIKTTDNNENNDIWAFHEGCPEQSRIFTRFMHCHSLTAAMELASRDYFNGVHKLLDVGGGSGAYCIALASAFPEMRCMVLDLPHVCPETDAYTRGFELACPIETYAADMFTDPWPDEQDVVFFSDIFHDWPAEVNVALAQRAFGALHQGGRIFVHEILLNPHRDSSPTPAFYSMAMAVTTKGKQYTFEELAGQLREAGFGRIRKLPSSGYYSLVIGEKVSCPQD